MIKRGKVPQPVEFGHRVLVIEDGAGFVCHYAILPRGAEDREVLVGEMRQVQRRLDGRIRSASFDRGFHSPENQRGAGRVGGAAVPARRRATSRPSGRSARRRWNSVGHGGGIRGSSRRSARCSRATGWLGAGIGRFGGYCRYVGLGVLGRNLHVLGKLLIAREDPKCVAGQSRRGREAA